MLRIIVSVHVGIALTVLVFYLILGFVPILKSLEITLYAALAIGHAALTWDSVRSGNRIEATVLAQIAVVYIALGMCKGIPYMLYSPISDPSIVLVGAV